MTWSSGGKTSEVTVIPTANGAFIAELDRMVLTNCRIDHVNTSGDFLVYPGSTQITDGSLTVTFREAWLCRLG